MEKRHRSSKFEEKYYFYEKSQKFKEYNHPKKRRQIQVKSLVMKNIRLKPVMTSYRDSSYPVNTGFAF